MKKKILFIMFTVVMLLFAACKGNDKETNFIPTQPPVFTEDNDIVIPDDPVFDFEDPIDIPDEVEEEPVYVGETTIKYVKLSSYGTILNVRSEPNAGENVVGFLVHTEPIEVISIDGDWAKVIFKDEINYVSAEFLVDTVPPYVSPPMLTPPAD
jgi:hypothetical protein